MTIPSSAPHSPKSSGLRPSYPPRSPRTPTRSPQQSPNNNNSQKLLNLNDVDLKSITLSPPFSQRHPPSPKRSTSKTSPSSPQRIRPRANSITSNRSRSNSINSESNKKEFNTSQRSIHTNNSSTSGSPQHRRTSSNSKMPSAEKNSSPGQLLMNSNERIELQKDVLLQNSIRRSESGGSNRSNSSERRRRRSRNNSGGRISSEIGETLRTVENDDDVDTYKENGSMDLEDTSSENCLSQLCNAVLCIFPKVEPLPWSTFAVLALWCSIPPACFILFFTQMGFGEELYYTISIELGHYSSTVAVILTVFIFTLYMIDADEWTSRCGSMFLDISIVLIICGLVMLVLLIADRFPYGMTCLFAIFQPLWMLALKLMCFVEKDTRVFVSWLSGPLFFISILIGAAWTAWVFANPENEWNIISQVATAERVGCSPNYEGYQDCRKEEGSDETCFHVETNDNGKEELVFPQGCDQSCTIVYSDCENGFILWVGPILIGMCTFFLSFFCTFLRTGKSYYATLNRHGFKSIYGSVDDDTIPTSTNPRHQHQQSTLVEGARERDVLNFGVMWLFILFAMWVTTSLAGTASGVTAALAALTLASFVASAMFIAVSYSKEERSQNAQSVFERLRNKYGEKLDIARGLFIVTCAPIILVYFGFSITNQCIRRCGLPFSQPAGEDSGIFTTRTRRQVNIMKAWDRAMVFTFAVYWGVAFMILQVFVANLTVVFLSLMIEKTANLGLGAVTGIMCIVGALMFLLPPVPGVPVYLTLGIVLPAQGHTSLGWIGSILYSIAVGLLLKLFSSGIQQKMIGQNLSHYVKVRQFVAINSKLMKSMRLVLGKNGLSVSKVAILIGGPDWPTSVLCGIMRLGLFQILLGTVPVVVLIAPTCLTGALLYMASLETDSGNPEFPWAGTVSTITASATAIVQFGAMIVAAYYLERTADKQAADVEAIEDDMEVKDADDKAAHLKRCYRDVTQWSSLPFLPKLLIQTSLVCIVTASYMVQLFSSLCFTPHSLTDSIDENLGGNIANLFLPLGWVSVGLFCFSIILIYIFESWGERKASSIANGIIPERESCQARFS